MDNSAIVIARVPIPNAGPPYLTTASKVAAMEFLREAQSLEVPKVLAWSSNADNVVESEYIIVTEAEGTQLAEVWDSLDIGGKNKIATGLAQLQSQMLSVTLSRYGALYFRQHAPQGCAAAEVINEVPSHVKQYVEDRFVVGPLAYESFWQDERAQMNIERGPWTSTEQYLASIAQREIS